MKILTMCQVGTSRSVALGYVLKYKFGIDTIACGWGANSPETINMLCKWADRIIVVQSQFVQYLPAEFHTKVSVYDVGEDRWSSSTHPELLKIFEGMVDNDPNFGMKV